MIRRHSLRGHSTTRGTRVAVVQGQGGGFEFRGYLIALAVYRAFPKVRKKIPRIRAINDFD